MLSKVFYVIIDHGISVPGHRREVVYGLNATDKSFLFQLISTMQIPGEKTYDTQMEIHSVTPTSDVGLARQFQNACLMQDAHINH